MHYCQHCDDPIAMAPQGDLAVCPQCGATEGARRLPLFVVTGASASGKTGIFPYLVRELPELAVFDVDWLIGPFQRACEFGEVDWPALRDGWLSVAHGEAQSGRSTVLLGPFHAGQLEDLPGRRWIGDIHVAVLDCADDVRAARLGARARWRERNVERHVEFAGFLREHAGTAVRTDDCGPEVSARRVAEWVRSTMHNPGPQAAIRSAGPPAA